MTNERIEKIEAENKRLQTIIDNRAEDLEVLAKYRAVQAENKRLREALEGQPVKNSFIGATHNHDAGAYGRCSYCLRYSDSPNCLSDGFKCDCGGVNGFSGSFKSPTHDSIWTTIALKGA